MDERVITFERQHPSSDSGQAPSASASMISRAIFFWQPIASTVTTQPASSSARNSVGNAVISLLLSATLSWPNTSPLPCAPALMM